MAKLGHEEDVKARVLFCVFFALLLGVPAVRASDPVLDFFRKIGHDISRAIEGKPEHHTHRKTSSHHHTAAKTSPTPVNAPSSSPEVQPAATTAPSVRMAELAPQTKKKRDAPFGIPVPGKKGLVTSPFSPQGNYIDVSPYVPGTEVRDPYTGQIFRVP